MTGRNPDGSWWEKVWDVGKGAWDIVTHALSEYGNDAAAAYSAYQGAKNSEAERVERAREFDATTGQREKDRTQQESQYKRSLEEQEANRLQGKSQYERSTGNAEAQAAARASLQLNAAPMADKAQALLLARMGVAPGTFQGRDYTKGTNDLTRDVAAPSANVTSAMQAAARGYKPGDGGFDTSTIRMLLDKMKASGFNGGTPPTEPTIGEKRPRPPILPPTTVFPPTTPTRPTIKPVPPGEFPPPQTVTPPPPTGPDEPTTEEEDDSPTGIIRRRMGAM